MLTRSKLYSLPLINYGTQYIESIPSYLNRLATAHTLQLKTLMIDYMYLDRNYTYQPLYLSRIRKIIDRLMILTSQKELQCLNLSLWDSTISSLKIFKKSRAWCPKCLIEMNSCEVGMFEPFIWTLMTVDYCDKHHILLEKKCPNISCEKHVPFFQNQTYGYCPYCSKWFGDTTPAEKIPSLSHELIRDFIYHSVNNTTLISAGELINKILIKQSSLKKFAEILNTNRNNIHRWQIGEKIPTLSTFMKICSSFNIPINSLFTSISPNTYKIEKETEGKHYDHVSIEEQFQLLIKNEESISLSKIANKFNCTYQYLQYNFPDLCELASENFKEYCLCPQLYKEIDKKNFKEVRIAFQNEFKNTKPITTKEFCEKYTCTWKYLKTRFPQELSELKERYIKFIRVNRVYKCGEKLLAYSDIKLKLDLFIIDESPISLAALSQSIGIYSTTLNKLFPDECKIVTKRFKVWVKEKALIRREQQKQKLLSVIDELILQGLFPSCDRVGKKIILLDPQLRQLRIERLKELGLVNDLPTSDYLPNRKF